MIDIKAPKNSWVIIIDPELDIQILAPDGTDDEPCTPESLMAVALAHIITQHPDWITKAVDEVLEAANDSMDE